MSYSKHRIAYSALIKKTFIIVLLQFFFTKHHKISKNGEQYINYSLLS
jgi:hypothetical protein